MIHIRGDGGLSPSIERRRSEGQKRENPSLIFLSEKEEAGQCSHETENAEGYGRLYRPIAYARLKTPDYPVPGLLWCLFPRFLL
jgi:hypothetical protein